MRIASKHEFFGTFALGGHEKCRVNRIVFVPVTLREEISERIYLLYRVNSVHIHQKARWNVVDFCRFDPRASVDGKGVICPQPIRFFFRINPRVNVDGKPYSDLRCPKRSRVSADDKTESEKQIESEKNMDKMVVSSARIYIDELISPVTEWKDFSKIFNGLQKEVMFYKNYFEFVEGILNTPFPFTYNLPFIIRSNSQRSADIYAMRYARLKNIHFNFLSLKDVDWRSVLNLNNSVNDIIYLTGLEQIKKSERMELISKLHKQNILFSFISQEEIPFSNIADISTAQNCMDIVGEVMPIREYEKMVITKYEGLYSDIELAKELGISRKSLWEKRKRYGIIKQRKSAKQNKN